MQPETPALLWHILDSGRFVLAETAAVTLTRYEQNRLVRSAIERELEIIGEAARRLSRQDPETAAALTDVPRIISFRNVLAHGYDVVDNALVWEIVNEYLPTLITEVEGLLATENGDTR